MIYYNRYTKWLFLYISVVLYHRKAQHDKTQTAFLLLKPLKFLKRKSPNKYTKTRANIER